MHRFPRVNALFAEMKIEPKAYKVRYFLNDRFNAALKAKE